MDDPVIAELIVEGSAHPYPLAFSVGSGWYHYYDYRKSPKAKTLSAILPKYQRQLKAKQHIQRWWLETRTRALLPRE